MVQLEQYPLFVLCECGCGTPLPPFGAQGKPRRFAHGHWAKGRERDPEHCQRISEGKRGLRPPTKDPTPIKPCECGCGTLLPAYNKRGQPSHFVQGHYSRTVPYNAEAHARAAAAKRLRYDVYGRKSPYWERHLDPRYIQWRKLVLARASFTCEMCGFVGGAKGQGLAAHHNERWADAPDKRFDPSNGQCLCHVCHGTVHGYATPRYRVRTLIPCECGCGTLIEDRDKDGRRRRFVYGHSARRPPSPAQQAARARLAVTQKGKPLPEHVLAAAAAARRERAAMPPEKRARMDRKNAQRRARRAAQHAAQASVVS